MSLVCSPHSLSVLNCLLCSPGQFSKPDQWNWFVWSFFLIGSNTLQRACSLCQNIPCNKVILKNFWVFFCKMWKPNCTEVLAGGTSVPGFSKPGLSLWELPSQGHLWGCWDLWWARPAGSHHGTAPCVYSRVSPQLWQQGSYCLCTQEISLLFWIFWRENELSCAFKRPYKQKNFESEQKETLICRVLILPFPVNVFIEESGFPKKDIPVGNVWNSHFKSFPVTAELHPTVRTWGIGCFAMVELKTSSTRESY